VRAGGVAFATTKNPTSLKIKLAVSGTFVAPASGIVDGVIATKNYVTYLNAAVPVAGVNENRTSSHIE
jgi:hypothetical protein